MTRAAAYCRISSSDDTAAVDRQEADCRALCLARGWEPTIFTDQSVSAYSGRPRPQYKAMMAAVAAGEFGAIVAYNADRLHRNLRELEDFVIAVEATKTLVATCTAGDLDLQTADGRLVARLLGSAARHQSERASERIKRKLLENARQGKPHGGRRATGYNRDGSVHESEAAMIRTAVGEILTGRSLTATCRLLNSRQMFGTNGKPWQATHLSRVLLADRAIGMRRDADGVRHKGLFPALITEVDQIHVRSLITRPERKNPRGGVRRWPLSGILECGVCSGPLVHSVTGGRGVYTCSPPPRGRRCVGVAAPALESYVIDQVIKASYIVGNVPEQPATLATADVDLDRDRVMLDELTDAFTRGELTIEQLTRGSAKVTARLAETEAALATAAESRARRGAMETNRDRWTDMSADEQRTAISTVVHRITISRTKRKAFDQRRVSIEWIAAPEDVAAGELRGALVVA